MGRLDFLIAELIRGALLGVCYGFYTMGWIVPAATLLPAALWPGIVGTIKRFRDLGHAPIWILPVLVYLSFGFSLGYVLKQPVIALALLGIYLTYVLCFKGKHPSEPT